MQSEWIQEVDLVLTVFVAIGAILTAYATLRIWGTTRRAAKADRPTVSQASLSLSQRPESPNKFGFAIDGEHATRWGIVSVAARPFWRQLISEIGGPDRAAAVTLQKKWVRCIKFDPPTPSSTILLRYDCPALLLLDFKLAMRSSPNETSRFQMRIKIRD